MSFVLVCEILFFILRRGLLVVLKYLLVVFVSSIVIFASSNNENTLINFTKNNLQDYSIVTLDDECDVVKISCDDIDEFFSLLNVEICNSFYKSDRKIIEGYCSKFNNFVVSNNRKINIQISICDDYVLIGSPLIKNSFWNYV